LLKNSTFCVLRCFCYFQASVDVLWCIANGGRCCDFKPEDPILFEEKPPLDSPLKLTNTTDPLVGTTIGDRYRILQRIGMGGMGVVYLCEHLLIGRQVAIKLLHAQYASDETFVSRFLNEGRAAGTLGHPNIVACTDMGQASNGSPYLVFDYLEGRELSEIVATQGAFRAVRAARIGMQIASALATAHESGIVHRDLKAENIFVLRRQDLRDDIKVLDFGISKFNNSAATAGLMMGTPRYMAPEQISDPSTVTSSADVYSLGVILYLMLAGRLPFEGDNVISILNKIGTQAPDDLQKIAPTVDIALASYVMKMLSKVPGGRPESMRAVEEFLSTYANLDSNSQVGTPPPGFGAGQSQSNLSPVSGRFAAATHISNQNLAPVQSVAAVGPATIPPAKPPSRVPVLLGALGLVVVGALGSQLYSRQKIEPAVVAVVPPPVVVEVPKPVVAEVPIPVVPAVPVNISFSAQANAPGAYIAFRGRVYQLPYTGEVKVGSAPESVEISAPAFAGQRFWITFDEARKLNVKLGKGSGVNDATELQTAIALGNAPDAMDVPVEAVKPAEAKPNAPKPKLADKPKDPTNATEPVKDSAVLNPVVEAKPVEPQIPANSVVVEAKPPAVVLAPVEQKPKDVAAPVGPPPGSMDPLLTKQAVARQSGGVTKCIERARMDMPNIKGKIVIQLQVAANGTVSDATAASSTLGNVRAEDCIVEQAKAWTLPAPAGGVPARINYPLVFQ
jgi:eukaryotic-like serine/threonine-protein kinase